MDYLENYFSSADLFDKDIEVTTDKGISTFSPNPYAPLKYFVRVCGGYRGYATRKEAVAESKVAF